VASREKDALKATATGATAGAGLGPWGAVIGAGLGLVQNIWSARRADSAHQREVRDLQRAGLNPILSARGSGAEVGPMESMASSGAQAARTAAEIELIKSQTDLQHAQATHARAQAWELMSFAPGRGAETQMRTALLAADEATRRQQLPLLLERAREEIAMIQSSSRAARARAMLDEAALEGALNQEEWERLIGEMGPATRFFLEILRSLRR